MLFKKEMIKAIVENRKSQTRRLVKEGETLWNGKLKQGDGKIIDTGARVIYYKKGAGTYHHSINPEAMGVLKKWQVNKDYSVQPKRGAKGIWWCKKCKTYGVRGQSSPWIKGKIDTACGGAWELFRIRITAIRKERLLEISGEDAKKEGFKSLGDFVWCFKDINKMIRKKPCHLLGVTEILEEDIDYKWNPDVWVLSFEVVSNLK